MDAYNITGILKYLGDAYNDKYISVKIAALLCIGGNDCA